MGLDSELVDRTSDLTDDSVEQMLTLAERLREANGGVLDDSAIQAVAEATGAPVEYVRLAEKLRSEKKKSLVANLRAQYLQLEPHTRRFVSGGLGGTMCAFFWAASLRLGDAFASNLLQIIALLWLTLGLYNACVARDSRTAAVVGAIFSAGGFAAFELSGFLLNLKGDISMEGYFILPVALGGALGGFVLQWVTTKFRRPLGLRDPVRERQELLRQLTELQDKLKSGERNVTFLSVDIVGSTRMKELADPLAVEYTFNEYHQFVERIARKHGGRVHSTAGDGVTCAFEQPQPALMAARNISGGLLELNTFRNKIGVDIVVRQGIHSGIVTAPEAGDITSLNFAHVIDISAHLQKAAPPGSIVVSDASAAGIPGGPSAIGQQRVSASGVGGTIWAPRNQAPPPPAGGPPPPPKVV